MKIKSPTFGTLALFHAEDGATVIEGDPLCEIEVMKTFYRVNATCAGVVSWALGLGEVVGEGDVLGEVK